MDEEDDGRLIEDFFDRPKKRKSVNSKRKGSRFELKLVKMLEARFGTGFSRSVGSGNRWSHAALPKHAREVFSGDLVVPEGFRFCFECKGGYDDINVHDALEKTKLKGLDEFLDQAEKDAERCERLPLLAWARTRRPWLVFLRQADVRDRLDHVPVRFLYGKWMGCRLEEALKLEDDFFYSTER